MKKEQHGEEAAVYLQMLEGIEDFALLLLSAEGNVKSWNKGAALLTGFTAGDVKGKGFGLLFSKENEELPKSLLEETKQTGLTTRELNLVKKNGSVFPATLLLTALTEGFSLSIHSHEGNNIMEHLRAVFENTSEGFVLLDRDFTVKAFNSYALKYSFLNSGDKLQPGKSIFDHFDRERVEVMKGILTRVLNGETIQYDRSYESDGKTVWLDFLIAPVFDKGLVKGICVTGHDITDKKLAEQEREFERNNLESLINNTNDFMWSVDTDFRLITCNQAFEERVRKLIGTTIRKGDSLLHPGYSANRLSVFKSFYERAFAGESFSALLELSADEYAEISFYPIRIAGEIIGTACFSRNISDQKRTEESLRRSEAHLKSANKDLETFIYRASHDLRGPLSSIIGLTNVSRLEIEDSKALQYIDMIQLSTKKLDETLIGLVHSMAIRDVEKLEDEINFKNMLDDVLERFKYYEGFSKMKFDIDVDLKSPFHSSRLILQPVIQNLVENAIKYRNVKSPESYCHISVSETKEDVIITFADNGIGMETNIHEKVFDVYYKGTQKSKGSGLGLYIVKTAVEKLHGTIRLESEPGKGSTFIITLPKNNHLPK